MIYLQKTNIFTKLLGIMAVIMVLGIIIKPVSEVFNYPSQHSSNIAYAAPGEGYTGTANSDEEAKEEDKKDKEKEKEKDKKDDEEGSSEDDEESSSDDEESSSGEAKSGSNEVKSPDQRTMSTLYAQIIMGPSMKKAEEDKEDKAWYKKAFDGAVSGIIGDGGVRLDVNYTEMGSLAQDAVKGSVKDKDALGEVFSEGRFLASTLKTFSTYGYISSVDGQSIAAQGENAVNSIGRWIGGAFAFLGLVMYSLMRNILKWVTDTLVLINPYRLIGITKGSHAGQNELTSDGMDDNPIANAVQNFFRGIGFDEGATLIGTLAQLGLLIILFILGVKVIAALTKNDIKGAQTQLGRWFIRIFVIFAALPLMAMSASSMGQAVKHLNEKTTTFESPAISHLVDARAWGSGTNFQFGEGHKYAHPDSFAKYQYIDHRYNPSLKNSRDFITTINKNGYKNLYNIENDEKIGYQLVGKWVQGTDYDVNTYIADLRAGKSNNKGEYQRLPGTSDFPEKAANKDGKKPSIKDIQSFMWSSTQNVDEDFKDVNNENYNPSLSIGTQDNSAFSTQSVVLLLQTSFTDSAANFYAYNFAPKGNQSNLKNVSTVSTRWKEVSMPGDGKFGVFASWLELIAESISYAIITVAVILALFTTNIFAAMIAFIKQAMRAVVRGSLNSAMATFAIFMGGLFSVLLSVSIPSLFISLVRTMAEGVNAGIGSIVPTAFVDSMAAITMMFLAWYVSFGAKIGGTNTTPVRMITTLPVDLAMNFESRVAALDRTGSSNVDFRSLGVGAREMGNHAKQRTSEMNKRFGQDARGTAQSAKYAGKVATSKHSGVGNVVKSGVVSGAKGAALGTITGGVAGGIAGAAKGGAKGLGKGAKNFAKDVGSAGKQGYKHGFSGNTSKNDSKKAISGIINKRKEQNEQDYAKGDKLDNWNDYNQHRGNVLHASEDGSAKEAGARYGHMPYGIHGNKALSEQSTSDKDELNKLTDNNKLYDENSQADMRKFSSEAALSAKHAVDDENKPMFSYDEFQNLRDSENEDEFVDNLSDTNRGMEYALNSESAHDALQDSDFVDEDGNIDMDKVNQFQTETDKKFAEGKMSKEDWDNKAKLDDAFVFGAQEKYRRPNGKFSQLRPTEDGKDKGNKLKTSNSSFGTAAAAAGGAIAGAKTAATAGENKAKQEKRENRQRRRNINKRGQQDAERQQRGIENNQSNQGQSSNRDKVKKRRRGKQDYLNTANNIVGAKNAATKGNQTRKAKAGQGYEVNQNSNNTTSNNGNNAPTNSTQHSSRNNKKTRSNFNPNNSVENVAGAKSSAKDNNTVAVNSKQPRKRAGTGFEQGSTKQNRRHRTNNTVNNNRNNRMRSGNSVPENINGAKNSAKNNVKPTVDTSVSKPQVEKKNAIRPETRKQGVNRPEVKTHNVKQTSGSQSSTLSQNNAQPQQNANSTIVGGKTQSSRPNNATNHKSQVTNTKRNASNTTSAKSSTQSRREREKEQKRVNDEAIRQRDKEQARLNKEAKQEQKRVDAETEKEQKRLNREARKEQRSFDKQTEKEQQALNEKVQKEEQSKADRQTDRKQQEQDRKDARKQQEQARKSPQVKRETYDNVQENSAKGNIRNNNKE